MMTDLQEQIAHMILDCADEDRSYTEAARRILALPAIAAALAASDWIRIADRPPPLGQEVLLYEPAVMGARRGFRELQPKLGARFVVERYPTYYPREASHWKPLEPPPAEEAPA